MNDDLRKIVETVIQRGGGYSALGRTLDIPRQNIDGWRRNGRIPIEWVPLVSAAVGMTKFELRPDVFGHLPPRGMMQVDMIDELRRAEQAFTPIDKDGERLKRAAAKLVPLLWEMVE